VCLRGRLSRLSPIAKTHRADVLVSSMRIIPVESCPQKKAYESFEAAIEGAQNNPLQPRARADSERLIGATVVDAYWTDRQFVVRFSNEQFLHIWACPEELKWEVTKFAPVIPERDVRRIGDEPVVHRWRPGPALGDHVQDCSALVAKRRGAEFQQLFVNQFGLWVYLRGHLVWHFGAIRRTDLDQPILAVCEDD